MTILWENWSIHRNGKKPRRGDQIEIITTEEKYYWRDKITLLLLFTNILLKSLHGLNVEDDIGWISYLVFDSGLSF